MALKKKKKSEGAPEWMVTYGDMMSLLLCFFIMLAAFSELKKDEDFKQMLESFKEAFGYDGGEGRVPGDEIPMLSYLQRLEQRALREEQFREVSDSEDVGMHGRQTTVQRIREGLAFNIGGLLTFEPGSADLKPEAKAELARIAEILRGQNNKVDVRGHTTDFELAPGSPYKSLWELSHARALAVMEFLTDKKQGIRPRRIRVEACANHEKLVDRAYSPPRQALNRRVQLIVTETLVQEVDAEQTAQTASAAAP